MATVLGPTAINELKFTTWSTKCKALGLLWDTKAATVSIPAVKLAKALTRVNNLLAAGKASRTAMLETIGSLRHVASCFPPARAFLQCLQEVAARAPKYGHCSLSQPSCDDLRWFGAVLQQPQRFNSIPVIYFAGASVPQYHVFMDPSGDGLCTLEPSLQTYIRQPFSQEDIRDTSINVRELRSAVLAALHWGPYWSSPDPAARTHVQFHIDNTSAVTWANRRASRNPTAQMYNRLLSLAEFQYNLVFSASHIAGKLNVMADAGSRVWTADHPLANLWANLSSSWTQTHLAEPFDNLSVVWDRCCMGWSRWLTASTASKRLGYFATSCWAGDWNSRTKGNQYSTVKLKLASIRWFHRRYKDTTLETSPKLELLLQGIKRLSAPRRKKQPLTPPFLRLLYRSLNLSRPRQRLLWGSIVIGYFFLLRQSEFLKIGKTRRFFCLKNRNTFYSDDNGRRVARKAATSVTIGLEGAKNDQYGRGAWRTMGVSGDKLLCPVKGLHHILQARKLLKCEADRHLCASLTSQVVVKAIKNTARRIGVPASNYSSHSIRIGGATALAVGGADKLSIKFLGRWLSDCYEEYPRHAATTSKGLSQQMVRPTKSSRAASK